MKKILGAVFVLLLVFSFVGCEEKSDLEKAQDGMKNAWEDTKNAAKKATD
jgi:predicted small lipoprotein YifL